MGLASSLGRMVRDFDGLSAQDCIGSFGNMQSVRGVQIAAMRMSCVV